MNESSSIHSEVAARPAKDVQPLVEAVSLTKDFPGMRALDNVEFTLQPGEVHVLFGENGAGKSTLVSIIAGVYQQTSGELRVAGRTVKFVSVFEARSLGISAVFQEFSLIPNLTVAENMFLGAEKKRHGLLDNRNLRRQAVSILDDLEFNLPPGKRIDQLTRAEQQMVEIAKALRSDLSILILDEPTASLTHHETEQLFKLIEKLKRQGVGIIYITHRIGEINRVGDRITVLRDGHRITTKKVDEVSREELVRLMTGRIVSRIFPKIDFRPGETVLKASDLHTADETVRGVSVTVRQGEIVGLAGLVGSGKSSFAKACFGSLAVSGGSVVYKGDDITTTEIKSRLKCGYLYLPPDRKTEGLAMMCSVRENISLVTASRQPYSNGWFLKRKFEKSTVGTIAQKLNLSPLNIERTVEHYSGGNQQKVMLGRGLTRNFDFFVFDEPTVGVDVGTRVEIYKLIANLCESGAAVMLVSSDLPEILNLCNRAYVFCAGRISKELTGSDITEENLLSNFFESKES